jgi:exodeoxyribonuclease V gamma subunit
VSAPVVQTALQALLDDPTRGGVPTGAVSFAAMTSLRGLPYRMIGVIGLDDGAFPTSKRPEEFDLMALDPRRGDRQRRHDERNVFLDLLLAARERFYLSYTGRNVRDNSPLPPSVLIAELLDYLVVGATQNPSDPVARQQARHQLVVEHPLQPFALAYFEAGGDTRRRSSNGEYCEALRQRLSAVAAANVLQPAFELAPEPSGAGIDDLAEVLDDDADDDAIAEPVTAFFPVPLAKAGPEFRDVTLDQLVRFFGNPCRHLLKLRLGIELARGDEELQDDEPFVVDWPTRSALAERVLPRLLEGATLAEMRVIARAGTEYPSGRLGEIALDRELQSLRAYADALATALQATRVAPVSTTLDFTLEGEAWRLAGGFGDLRANGYIGYRYDNARARDYLDGWIRHLFLNVAAPPGVALRTAWHSRDGTYVVPPCADAHLNLEAFLRLYRQGLERPLHFYPKSAWAYMTHGRRIRAASSAWLSSTHHEFGEDRDPAYRLALRGVPDPLDAEFERAAVTVFAPLLEIIVDGRLA